MPSKRAFVLISFFVVIELVAFQNCGQPQQMISKAAISPASAVDVDMSAPSDVPVEDPSLGFNDLDHSAECPPIKGTDIYLNIDQVQNQNAQSILAVQDSESSISVLKPKLKVRAIVSQSISQIHLSINNSSSFMMGEDQNIYALADNGAETSIVTVPLSQAVTLEAGQEYDMDFQLDLGMSATLSGRKCLVRPSVQSVSLIRI